MKKILFALCMIVAALTASAQQGKLGIGLDLGVVPMLEGEGSPTNFELGAKVQYGITDAVRLEAALDYSFKDSGWHVATLSGNVHYLIPVTGSFRLYPLAGLGYGRAGGWGDSYNRILFNIGLGGEYAVTSNVAVNLEFKYQYMKNFERLPIKLGVTYTF